MEIEARAWIEDIGFAYLATEDGLYCGKFLSETDGGLSWGYCKEMGVIELFTGVYDDPQLIKIYAGDILLYPVHFFNGGTKNFIASVVWIPGGFIIKPVNADNGHLGIIPHGGRIIGNIHENPELLGTS